MNLYERIGSPTPPFFKKLRNIGLGLVALSTVIFSSPVALPVLFVKIAGYLAVAGGAMGAVSQTVITDEQ